MASTESLGLMLFTIEIMKARLTASGFSPVHAGLHQLSQNAMHRIAIGDPQGVRHQLLRQAPDLDGRWRIRVVRVLPAGLRQPWFDRLRPLPLPCCGSGTVFTSISPRARASLSACGSATRRRSFAAREPVQLQLWLWIFGLQSRRSGRCRAGPWMSIKLRDDGIVPLICPTCQNVFAGPLNASVPATAMLLCMGLFSIF